MVSQIAVAHERADAQRPIGHDLDPAEPRQPGDVDETLWPADAALHEIQQIGAAGEKGCLPLGGCRNRFGDARWTDIVEAVHAASPALFCIVICAWAASTASTMPA